MTPLTFTCGAKERAHRLGRDMTQKRLSHTTAIKPCFVGIAVACFSSSSVSCQQYLSAS